MTKNDSSHLEDVNNESQDEAEEVKEETLLSSEELLEESQDKYLRLQAEFDNFRKRTTKERADLIRYGSEDLALALLEVLDNFNRAIVSARDTADFKTMMQGLIMIQKQFVRVFEEKNIHKMQVQDTLFDPNIHEAVSYEESNDPEQDQKIISELQSGYRFHDKVLRCAKVTVAKYEDTENDTDINED